MGRDESFIQPCIPDSNLYRVTNIRCRIGTVFSPGDGHVVARNMQRKEINVLRKFVHQVGSIYKILKVELFHEKACTRACFHTLLFNMAK